jgi:hypothetical protein
MMIIFYMESIFRENGFQYSVSRRLYFPTHESKSVTRISNKNYSSIRCSNSSCPEFVSRCNGVNISI